MSHAKAAALEGSEVEFPRSSQPRSGEGNRPHRTTLGTLRLSNPAMVDIDLIVQTLRSNGHDVQGVHHVPDNAGEYEFTIDGKAFNLEGARAVLEQDELK
jgi:hypothetical protein